MSAFIPARRRTTPEFAQNLANGCEIYVNDAFAVSHRAHASVEAITKVIPTIAAGFLMKNEMTFFDKAMTNPVRPLVAILGGAKVSGKLEVLETLVNKVDKIIIGGGMAFTFLKAHGLFGRQIAGGGRTDRHRQKDPGQRQKRAALPFICRWTAWSPTPLTPTPPTSSPRHQDIPEEWMALDIGPASATLFGETLRDAKTVIWNGPMGVFEMDAFARGTFAVAESVANCYAITVIGGGDTDAAVHKAGVEGKVSYISTGGGAFLELLEGKILPGVKALDR